MLPPSPSLPTTSLRSSSLANLSGLLRVCLPVLILAVFLGAVPVPASAQSEPGRIEGRVLNADTRTYLNNARVLVEGTRLETLTNSDGEFRLASVPAGEVRLKVIYAGMEPQSATVTVTPGGVGRKDFELALSGGRALREKDVVALESFVVESTAMNAAAAAINEQKMSPNIKNVIVLDEIGDLGDGN